MESKKVLILILFALSLGIPMIKGDPKYTPLNVFEYYNEVIEPRMIFDGANYIYVTPYGNYTISQPLNILSFTDYNGNEIIEKSVFVLQYNSTGSWLPLIDFYDSQGDPVVSIANQTHFRLDYNVYDKKIIVGTGSFSFTVNPDPEIRPKIEVKFSKMEGWSQGSFRWIWDIVPDSQYKHWKNQTSDELVDISTFSSLKELYPSPENTETQQRIRISNNVTDVVGVLDVSDFGGTLWYGGQEPKWNSKGFVTIFPVDEATIDPIFYTETTPLVINIFSGTPDWETYDLLANKGIPANSVVEIIAANYLQIDTAYVGAREAGSVLDRRVLLSEAEDGGFTLTRFLANVNGSGIIEFYTEDAHTDSLYYVVGYWTGLNFTEQWTQYNVLSSEDDMWHETDGSELSLQSNRTHLISLINSNTGTEDWLGVRNTSSSLDRRLEVMEAEGGGVQTASLFVQSDISSKIDVYTSDYTDVYFINQGYFDETLTFKEDYWGVVGDSNWANVDLSARLDEDGRVCDFVLGNEEENTEQLIGARHGNSTNLRYFDAREAEGGGVSGYGMSAQSDNNGGIDIYDENLDAYTFFTGYFVFEGVPPYSPNITTPNLLFGAGFNASNAFIDIRWNHSGTVDDYEIHHGTDNITLTFLVYTSDLNYTHSGLNNGSYHWYKVRSTHYFMNTSTWYNSTFSPLNLERVHYVLGEVLNVTVINATGFEYRYYNVTSFENKTGVLNYGGIPNIAFVDNLNMSFQEVVGSPGFDIRFNWSSIPDNITAINILIRSEYTGNLAHIVWIKAYNFSSGLWVNLMLIPDGAGFEWYNCSVSGYPVEDFLNNGRVWVKVEHDSPGNINHVLLFDYGQLRGIVPLVTTLDAWSINWLIGLIWIALVAIGYFKENKILIMFSGFLGLIFGLLIMGESAMASIALILFSLYLLYEGT